MTTYFIIEDGKATTYFETEINLNTRKPILFAHGITSNGTVNGSYVKISKAKKYSTDRLEPVNYNFERNTAYVKDYR